MYINVAFLRSDGTCVTPSQLVRLTLLTCRVHGEKEKFCLIRLPLRLAPIIVLLMSPIRSACIKIV